MRQNSPSLGTAPNVDTRAPDVPIRGHLTEREFTLAGRLVGPQNLTGFLLESIVLRD
jgi:hypothetical protein